VLAAISGSPAVTINAFYLLTYPLDALAAFWALRRLGVSRPASLACAVLFALLPYHFFRSTRTCSCRPTTRCRWRLACSSRSWPASRCSPGAPRPPRVPSPG